MPITFDPAKSERNRRERRLPFDVVDRFVWSTSVWSVSKAQNFDTSTRFVAIGKIGRLTYVVVFTIGGAGIRVVSLRRADAKEGKRWLANQTRS